MDVARLVIRLALLTSSLRVCGASEVVATAHAAAMYAPATTAPALLARAQCPANTFQCPTSLGAVFSDICCQNGQTCAFDANNSPACCPAGAVCTGTAPATPHEATATAPVSYVPNQYFSFPYAATTFGNSASCASAVQACSSNNAACLSGLQGIGGYAVTINVPGGGGPTVGAAQQNLGASATGVCSSLSSQACSKLEATKCESFGQGSTASLVRGRASSRTVIVAVLALVFHRVF